MKKNPYEIDPRHDYRQHWSRRDREDPRLMQSSERATWDWIASNNAEQMAMATYKDSKWQDPEIIDDEYKKCIARDIYGMVNENLYGWGDMALNRIQDEGYDAFFEEVYELAKKRTFNKFNTELVKWCKLHLRDVSVRYDTFEEFKKAEEGYILAAYPAGVTDKDWNALQMEAQEVTDAILKDRAEMKAQAGGFWTGD